MYAVLKVWKRCGLTAGSIYIYICLHYMFTYIYYVYNSFESMEKV